MPAAYILLGSNIGDKATFLKQAIHEIENSCGEITKKSSIYETEPWGFKSQNSFYNQVISINTNLQPEALLEVLLSIEIDLGRIRSGKGYSSRTIDLDILFYDNLIIKNNRLIIPHPKIENYSTS